MKASAFKFGVVEVTCMYCVATYLRVVAVGELEVEGDARGGLAGGDHVLGSRVLGVLQAPGGEGGHCMAVVRLGKSVWASG